MLTRFLWGALTAGALLSAPVRAAETSPVEGMTEAEAGQIESYVISVLFHELGHAIIDLDDLPVLGREEDAADNLSALLVNDVYDEPSVLEITKDVSGILQTFAANSEIDSSLYADTHSLDLQRYYNLVCLIYGADPDNRADFAKALKLPDDRAESCAEEYDLANGSWGAFLGDLYDRAPGKSLTLRDESAKTPLNAHVADVLSTLVDLLNERLVLPRPIPVVFKSCDEANAFYDPEPKEIQFCTELAEDALAQIRG
ncbi:MAG: DUF4344 domain-containing metallopeptidase [Rhodobacteraceae bacterium]|nr:DUF4344 domain-containing metallopeptidase [Paracoccaceae bacterium]